MTVGRLSLHSRRGRLNLHIRHGVAQGNDLPNIIILSLRVSRVNSADAELAPHAGAGTYFRYEAKVSKGSPKDTFGIRSGNGF